MDRREFGKVVIDSGETLYRVAKSFLKNDYDCEDVTQEAISVAFSNLRKLRNDALAKTWLIRILINECYHFLNKQKRLILVSNDEIGDQPAGNYEYSELYIAITSLGLKHRIPIVLYYLEGFTTIEIAQILKISQGTVKSRLSRARAQLKEQLEIQEGYAI